MKMQVIRDVYGKAINIGPWDYMIEVTPDGAEVAHNPLPLDCTWNDEVIVIGWDGGLYVQEDTQQYAPDDSRRKPVVYG